MAQVQHVVIRKLEHLTGTSRAPSLGYAVETRDRAGPAHKLGAGPGETVWLQLHGGLIVAKARVGLCWVGEYSFPEEIRRRTAGSEVHDLEDFWRGRPRGGYAAVASLTQDSWVEPFWAGPRTYGYEWVVLENEKKLSTWTDTRDGPRGGDALERSFREWLADR